MAPRRNNSGPSSIDVQNLLGIDSNTLLIERFTTNQDFIEPNMTRCCIPNTECLKSIDFGLINLDDLSDCVRVVCNNESCQAGNYMHRECFDAWESRILNHLKTNGRARSWSDKQRQQNLWTKKGYELVYKICSCRCGRGHLKKDLDWAPPQTNGLIERYDDEANKKKKKKNKNQKSVLGLNVNQNSQQVQKMTGLELNTLLENTSRGRSNSLSSSNGSSSPPMTSSEQSISPIHSGLNPISNQVDANNRPLTPRTITEIYSDRVRQTSGANGIFSRRLDFSSFNVLPKSRINSYSIKIEDEGNHGNDETRLFILSSLAAQHKSRVACVLCEEPMLVFDRYPLVDGTFFLSPRRHTTGCIEVKYENRVQYLTSVCMACLEGVSPSRVIRCRFCTQKWDGSSLVMGTMYSYDIFAAMPCCTERLKCNNCFKLLLHPNQRLNFFSDYSHSVSCPYCTSQDMHFVKPLNYCYTKQPCQLYQQWP
ncbi:headcase protein [Culicoides brevitarsis]|uniref:headcase protein n=1 Tax=Culicoides brevitarsis TaxID=469753 RepID=UPI00307C8C0C